MAFVNEVISQEDWKKYDIDQFKRRCVWGGSTHYWTIDRERNIWFRLYFEHLDRDANGVEMSTEWDFYWKGSFIPLETKTVRQTRSDDGERYGYLKVLKIEIPENIQQYKSEIYKDLKEAFEASFIGRGIYTDRSKVKSCKVDLEYEGELI
ncbi:MAG: hypothetical protein LBB59_05475 [Campylobacteraceae bacterium]|jgi:hypothetical protein|nr:hypothetical protein [Campylobacteraceae bacterium]